ncbi:MAG TPA: phosphate ABC transporter substrate-binding protein [Roseiflexaceae bacterium]|nr:phosphate ABC transporter substrate-binding protein [Roseiflexaceae bacterium]
MFRATVFVFVLLLAACGTTATSQPTAAPTAPPATAAALSGRLTFAGSTTMQPLVEKLAEQYRTHNPAVELEIAAGGSVVGINAVQDGSVDIGMASRPVKDQEVKPGMRLFPVAYDALAIIVHPDNPVRALTVEQLRRIYQGGITNWRELGGPDAPIRAVVREVSSGTRGAFDELVLDGEDPATQATSEVTAGEVEQTVAGDTHAIGYVGFGNVRPDIATLSIDGVQPSPEAVRSGEYKLRRPLTLLTGSLSRPLAQSFVEFALSPEGQRLVAEDGWVPIGGS